MTLTFIALAFAVIQYMDARHKMTMDKLNEEYDRMLEEIKKL